MTEIGKKISRFSLLLEYLTISLLYGYPETDYCFLVCSSDEDLTHIICKRLHHCGPVEGCNTIESDVHFRKYILHQHNDFRNLIANGSEKGPYGNTGAKNMHALSYDMELEFIAGCFTNMCDARTQDDWCYDSQRFPVGKNLVYGKIDNWTVKAVPEFYRGISYINDINEIHEYRPVRFDLRHMESFLRLVWAESKYVGCSRSINGTVNGESMLACLYGPALYKKGRPVYKMAETPSEIASECEDGRTEEFNALCGKIDPIPSNTMWTYKSLSSVDSVHTKIYFYVCWGLYIITIIVNQFYEV